MLKLQNYPILTEEEEKEIYDANSNLRLKTVSYEYEDDGVEVVLICRAASRASLGAYTAAITSIMNEQHKSTYQATQENFVKNNVVWPDVQMVHSLFEVYPGLASKIASTIHDHSGAGFKEKKRK